ncbi:MAG: glycoside hydrolase family 52 protein [Terrimicrobiaceae bacterium]|nr:glycoside hydrolase family 52 protein [Terrimicrobiaceae bacterium]
MGAWSSLTFGLPGGGVGIESEDVSVQIQGALLAACSRGPGRTTVFPFFTDQTTDDYEGRIAGSALNGAFRSWTPIPSAEITRSLGPAIDEFVAADMRLRITSPRGALDLTGRGEMAASAIVPALLLELEVDNRTCAAPVTGFLGLAYTGPGRMRPLDWTSDDLVGVGFQDRWALAARGGEDVFTIRSGSISSFVEKATPVIHAGGNEGGIAFRVKAGEKKTLTAVFGFYRGGQGVVQGLRAGYAYTRYFDSVESVCREALLHAGSIREAAAAIEERWGNLIGDATDRALMAQAAQGYYANSSLLSDDHGSFHWSVCEGQFAWRNTLDLAVDHLAFELAHHPSVPRRIIDTFIEQYSYRDTVRFSDDPNTNRPGGLSFTHDQGNYTSYSPKGTSGYEQRDKRGVYAYMTTEQLLNGAYCTAGVALLGADDAWARRHIPLAQDLISSMENREHYQPALRDGILRGQSDRAGRGREVTTYDAIDHALQNSAGSIYIVVKTWCAALLLARWMSEFGSTEAASPAIALANRTAATLEGAFCKNIQAFPPNLIDGGDSFILAALDPLAVPIFCGLDEDLRRFPGLLQKLSVHARTCLRDGVCVDSENAGLRLSSTSENTWISKIALCLASFSWLEGKPAKDLLPESCRQFVRWMHTSSAQKTVSDQIEVRRSEPLGGSYYPRVVSAWVLLAKGGLPGSSGSAQTPGTRVMSGISGIP